MAFGKPVTLKVVKIHMKFKILEIYLMVEILDRLIPVHFEMHNLHGWMSLKSLLNMGFSVTLLLGSTFKLLSLICKRFAAFCTLRRSSLPRLNETPEEITANRFFNTVPLNGRDKLHFYIF